MKMWRMRTRRLSLLAACSVLLFFCAAWLTFDALFAVTEQENEIVTVENYVGLSLEQSQFAPWMTVKTEYKNDDTAPAGTVLSQDPPAQSRRKLTPERPTVELTLTVSLGKEYAVLPNVLGENVRDAELRLRSMGFSVELIKRESAYAQGTVYEMYPRANTELPTGSSVRLVVSVGTPEQIVKVPSLVGMTRGEALTELWLCGLSVAEVIETENESDTPPNTVIRQSHQAGTLVRAGTAVTIYVCTATRTTQGGAPFLPCSVSVENIF